MSRIWSPKKRKKNAIYLLMVFFVIAVSWFCYWIVAKQLLKNNNSKDNSIDSTKIEVTVPDNRKKVCLDPGHGGGDAGAVYGKIYESNLNLEVALKVKTILEENNYKVFLTRTNNILLAKRERAYYCNSIKADILVSIHHNSYENDRAIDYATTLYYKESDQLLANSILESTSKKLAIQNQGVSKFDNSLLWVAEMPATLSESFFISNSRERILLSSQKSTRLSDEAEGIATGIINYFTNPGEIPDTISAEGLIIDRSDLGD